MREPSSGPARVMPWAVKLLIAVVALGAVLAIGLRLAIAQNGPAVLDLIDRIAGPSTGVERSEAISFGPHPAQKLAVFRNSANINVGLPVLVFIHGGSWASGDPEDYGFIGRGFASEGFVTVNAGYRLGEAGRFPAMLEDGAAALQWVRANIARYGGDPDRIVLAGHSAGAYNAAMLALDRKWLVDRGVPAEAIKGVVGLAGPYDFYPFDTASTQAAFGNASDPQVTQPVNHMATGAPPFLLIHGEEDTTVKPRNSRALAEHLAKRRVETSLYEIPDFDHSAPLLHLASPWRRNPQVRDAVLQFAREVTTSVPVQDETR